MENNFETICSHPKCKNKAFNYTRYCKKHKDWGMITYKPIGKWKEIAKKLDLTFDKEGYVSLCETLCELLNI